MVFKRRVLIRQAMLGLASLTLPFPATLVKQKIKILSVFPNNTLPHLCVSLLKQKIELESKGQISVELFNVFELFNKQIPFQQVLEKVSSNSFDAVVGNMQTHVAVSNSALSLETAMPLGAPVKPVIWGNRRLTQLDDLLKGKLRSQPSTSLRLAKNVHLSYEETPYWMVPTSLSRGHINYYESGGLWLDNVRPLAKSTSHLYLSSTLGPSSMFVFMRQGAEMSGEKRALLGTSSRWVRNFLTRQADIVERTQLAQLRRRAGFNVFDMPSDVDQYLYSLDEKKSLG